MIPIFKAVTFYSIFIFSTQISYAQKFMSRNVDVDFISETPLENIEAHNNQASALFDEATNEIVFQVPIRGFHFEKALMEEHFNENYLESDEYPKATLQGIVIRKDDSSDEVEVEAVITIHGISLERSLSGLLSSSDGNWVISSEFEVDAEDFGIKIPGLVRNQIAENIVISVNATLNPR